MSSKTVHVMTVALTSALLTVAGCGSSKSSSNGSGGHGGGAGGTTAGTGGTTTGAAGNNGAGAGGQGPDGGVGGGPGTEVDAGQGGAAGASAAGGAGGLPGGKLGTTQCSDGLDNDGDGKVDLADPECVGVLDNDESSFATGIHGDNMDACNQDCFFDGDSGMGNDGCEWQLKCDPANTAGSCAYDPSYKNCTTTQSQKCIKNCRSITPNGCDCFGCCVVAGVDHPVRLDPTCTAADFGDPAKCPVCTQQTSCMNTCEKCQLCLGKTTLDPSCAMSDGGTPTPVCPAGQVVCGTDLTLCSEDTTCVSGCCVPWSAIQ